MLKDKIIKCVKKMSILEWILILIFFLQFIMTVYFNFVMLPKQVDFDSSWTFLRSALMWNEKTVCSSNWGETANLFLDSPMLLASVIYGITNDLFLAWGIANIISVSILIFCMFTLLKDFDLKNSSILLCLNLLISPYALNGVSMLGYYNDLLCGATYYTVRTILFVMIIKAYFELTKKGKVSIWAILSVALCFWAGVGSGVYIIVMILLPCVIYIIEKVLIDNTWKYAINKSAIYVYMCVFSVLAGKLFANHVLGYIAFDADRSWTSIERLWTNAGAVIQGLMILLGVLPVTNTQEAVMSLDGIVRVFPLVIFAVIICSIVYGMKKCLSDLKKSNNVLLFLCNVVLCNFLMFALFNVQYGSAIFEERYLICTYMAIIILVGFFYNSFDKRLLVTDALWLAIVVAILGNNFVSNQKCVQTTNESWQIDEILEVVDRYDAKVVYIYDDSARILGRALRVYDLSRVYKCIVDGRFPEWGDYKYYNLNESYMGETLIIIPKQDSTVPEYILGQSTMVAEFDYVYIFYCDHNAVDYATGVTSDTSIDYFYSPGMVVQNGSWWHGGWLSNGAEGYIAYGPGVATKEGTYNFTLYYDYLDGDIGDTYFDVALDVGYEQVGMIKLDPNLKQVSINNVSLEEGHTMEYRVYTDQGAVIRANKIVIEKVD